VNHVIANGVKQSGEASRIATPACGSLAMINKSEFSRLSLPATSDEQRATSDEIKGVTWCKEISF